MDPLIRVDLALTGRRPVAPDRVRPRPVLLRHGRIAAMPVTRAASPSGHPGDQRAGRLGAFRRDGGMRRRRRTDVVRYDIVALRSGTAAPDRTAGDDAATRFRPRGTPQ